MLLRAILPLVAVAIAGPNTSQHDARKNIHDFTASDTKNVTYDVAQRTFGTWSTHSDEKYKNFNNTDFPKGYVDSDASVVASPVFWRAILDYSHITGSTIWDAVTMKEVNNVISFTNYNPELGQGGWGNAEAARWAGIALTMARYNGTKTGPGEHWLPFAEDVFGRLAKQWNAPPREVTKGGITESPEDRDEPTGQAEWGMSARRRPQWSY